eukprot:CAMPEP_0179020108 /NCGR_PEP_ID=MMETSP0796-20121207/5212_1 /TAXON_ID=73915 /ORGANISM="Pyrodinium bahamense, Strain pbaha01" /LENGTH=340 /DNA_ID=CAMNT_0020715913 /DNA_START=146 /DNA_END=1167 /DNA_ORIENTATION=-
MVLNRTGVYILTVSNCGRLDGFALHGEVVVSNPYGLLPGNECYKLPLVGALALTYGFMVCTWAGWLLRWRTTLFEIQKLLACVLAFACLDALVVVLFVLGVEHNWHSRPRLSGRLTFKIAAFGVIYLAFHLLLQTMLVAPHTHDNLSAAVVAVTVAVAVLNIGLAVCIFRALWGVIQTLQEQQQFDRLLMFQRLRCILVFCLAAALAALLVQMVNLSQSISVRWKWQWFWQEGVNRSLFLAVHVSMIYLWAPNKYSQAGASHQGAVALLPTCQGSGGETADNAGIGGKDANSNRPGLLEDTNVAQQRCAVALVPIANAGSARVEDAFLAEAKADADADAR